MVCKRWPLEMKNLYKINSSSSLLTGHLPSNVFYRLYCHCSIEVDSSGEEHSLGSCTLQQQIPYAWNKPKINPKTISCTFIPATWWLGRRSSSLGESSLAGTAASCNNRCATPSELKICRRWVLKISASKVVKGTLSTLVQSLSN